MPLSAAMSARILGMSRARIDESKRLRTFPEQPSHHIGALLHAMLLGTDEDSQAENLIRLLIDWEQRGWDGAFGAVLSGRVDLVALCARSGQ